MNRKMLSDLAGPTFVAVAAIATAAAFWIAADSMERNGTFEPKPTPTVTVTVTADLGDDGPQNGSTDCWDAWLCAKVAQGYQALDHEYDGHNDCVILVGDTSLIECRGGFRETS